MLSKLEIERNKLNELIAMDIPLTDDRVVMQSQIVDKLLNQMMGR